MPDAMINGFDHHWEEGGSGEALVMLHGAAGAGRGMYQHIPELSKTFRVIIPDMRSMGQSEHVTSIPPNAWVQDVRGLLDHLGIEWAHLYGASLGARVALRFAVDYPNRTKSLVLDNPIVLNEGAGNLDLNTRMSNPDGQPPEVRQRYESFHGPEWRQVVLNYFNIRNDPELQEYYNLRELCKQVTVPTLITRGDSRTDLTHPLLHAAELLVSMPNSHLWIKPEGGALSTPEGYERIRALQQEAVKQPISA